jgi:DNA-binding transcriptional regulator YiaG
MTFCVKTSSTMTGNAAGVDGQPTNTKGCEGMVAAVPNRLRELREAAGLSRFELAIRLQPRTTERTIARWEALEASIPDSRKIQLARFFGVSVDQLMHWETS